MKYKPDQYIISDSYGVYYVRISIPIWLRNAFGGRKTLVRSLNTSDLRVARRKRDVIADEFHHIRQIAEPPKPDSLQDTISYLKSVAKYAKAAPKASAPIISQCPSLNKMLEIYLTHNADRLKIGTLSKTRKAVELFLNYLRKKDVELNDINRTTVTGWLDHLRETKAVQTVANYLSAMANILDLASSRYQDAPQLESNVFRGHKLNTAQSRQSYEAFTDEEITKLISTFNKLGEDELRDLSAIAPRVVFSRCSIDQREVARGSAVDVLISICAFTEYRNRHHVSIIWHLCKDQRICHFNNVDRRTR
ncbi:hypothetical protein INE22_003167 [Escherichia coli]|nr:hypothetical protein [Escherichia coli]